jgi:hypothetical protein
MNRCASIVFVELDDEIRVNWGMVVLQITKARRG